MTKALRKQYIIVLAFAIDTISAEVRKTGMLLRNNAISALNFCAMLNLTITRL